MHGQRQVWLGWLSMLVWMGLIFAASTDTFSAAHTSRIIEPILRWLFDGHLSASAVERVHFLIRKLAHLSEYAVLAILTWNALRLSSEAVPPRAAGWNCSIAAGLIAACYAAGDEFHQSFVPSRTASVTDVLIDTAGAITGLALLQGCRLLRRRWAGGPRPPDKS